LGYQSFNLLAWHVIREMDNGTVWHPNVSHRYSSCRPDELNSATPQQHALVIQASQERRQAIAEAAELDNTTQAEWARQALLRCLNDKGVLLRRGAVELVGATG
jgi:hypothetical protein